jgi:hypothetical protein
MNDPKIVYPQNPITSVSLLTNVIGMPIAVALSVFLTKYGLGSIVTPEFQAQVAAGIVATLMSVANIVVRKWFTSGGDLSFSAPLTQTPSQTLAPGSATVVSTSPAESAAPAVIAPIPTGTHTVTVRAAPAPVPPPAVVTITPGPVQ